MHYKMNEEKMDKNRFEIDTQTVITLNEKARNSLLWSGNQRFQWLICLVTGQIAAHSTRTLMPICAVAISKEFSWNKSHMGAILGCFFWGYMFVQIFTGNLADGVGGEAVLLFGALGWSTITILYVFADQLNFSNTGIFIYLLFLRVLNGIFQGFHTPSIASIISNRVAIDNRGLTFTIQNAGAYLGTIISGSLGSILLQNYGWKMCFIIFGLFSILWIYMTKVYIFIPNSPSLFEVILNFKSLFINECKNLSNFIYSLIYSDDNKMVSKSQVFVAIEYGIPDNITTKIQTLPWHNILSSLAFWSMLAGQFAYGYSHFLILSWMPTYFQEVHSTSKGWIFNVLPWMVSIPVSIFGGYLSDSLIRKGYSITYVRKIMETLSQLGTALFLHFLTYSITYEYALLFMTMAVAFSGFHCSGIILNPLDLAPNHGGAIFGIMNMAGAFPGFLGVYISGCLLEYFKNWNFVFNHASVICLLGCMIYIVFGSSEQII